MLAAEIFQWLTIDDGTCRRSKPLFKNVMSIGSRNRVHRVEPHAKAVLEKAPQHLEVKQLFHNRRVICEGIDDNNLGSFQTQGTLAFEVHVEVIEREILRSFQRVLVDALSDAAGGGTAIANVVLDAKIRVGTAGIVAGREHQATKCAATADDRRDCRRRKYSAAAHKDTPKFIRRSHADNRLDGGAVMVAAVTAYNQGLGGETFRRVLAHGVEHGLNEIFHVVRLHEHASLLAQSRRARSLIVERCCLHYYHFGWPYYLKRHALWSALTSQRFGRSRPVAAVVRLNPNTLILFLDHRRDRVTQPNQNGYKTTKERGEPTFPTWRLPS